MYAHVHKIYIEIITHNLTAGTLHDDVQKLKQPPTDSNTTPSSLELIFVQ